jgi:VWFA-related protein
VGALAAACPLGAATQIQPTPGPTPFVQREEVLVGRVLINTHVLRKDGTAIPSLGLSDFQVEIDGRPATVESVEWVDQETPARPEQDKPNAEITNALPAADASRLIILLFQWEVASQKQIGFVRMQRQAVNFVRGIHPGDRVAVLLFDSRLWLVQDFTSDREALAAAVESVLGRGSHPGDGLEPSLGTGLSNGGKDATGIEKALLAIATALRPIRGAKSLVFFGWGIGEWQATFQNQRTGYVRNRPEYGPARRALNASETAVFCLDVSDGAHNLWEGLDRTAFDTGGFYLPTYLFPEFAIDRLRKALHGYYALVVVKPQGVRGRHALNVRVRKALSAALVLHRSGYEDDEDSPGH